MILHIDIISDVNCPWCFIGKRRLEKAIAAQQHEIRVRWLPFQLNPTIPKEGISRKEYRTKKFGSWERKYSVIRPTWYFDPSVDFARFIGDFSLFSYVRSFRGHSDAYHW